MYIHKDPCFKINVPDFANVIYCSSIWDATARLLKHLKAALHETTEVCPLSMFYTQISKNFQTGGWQPWIQQLKASSHAPHLLGAAHDPGGGFCGLPTYGRDHKAIPGNRIQLPNYGLLSSFTFGVMLYVNKFLVNPLSLLQQCKEGKFCSK